MKAKLRTTNGKSPPASSNGNALKSPWGGVDFNFDDVDDNGKEPVSQDDINHQYDTSVSRNYADKKVDNFKRIEVKFYKNSPDDMAAYNFYSKWAKKGNGINARKRVIDGIGIITAMSKEIPDVDYILKRYPAIAAEVRCMENDVMRQEIEILKQQIQTLTQRQNEHSKLLAWMREPVKMVAQKMEQLRIVKQPTKTKGLNDGTN